MNKCKVKNCHSKVDCKGFCKIHYLRWHQYGRFNRINKKHDIKSNSKQDYKNKWRKSLKAKEYDKKYQSARLKLIKEKIFEKYGNKCKDCGISDKRVFQIDHINGGGTIESRLYQNRITYFLRILKDKKGKYQLLCANCNVIKKIENKENKKRR